LEPLTDAAFLDVLARVTEGREVIDVRTAIELRTGEREVRVGGVLVHSTTTASLDGVRCFEERIEPSPRLLVVGAGHDALPVARFADELGWAVDVYDWRPALLTRERFASASLHLTPGPALSSRLQVEAGVLAVVMAHHIDYDASALSVLLRNESVASVGLLGPRHRSAQVLALVEARDGRLTDAQRSRLRAPVGLDLGAEGPAAIALSIIAEAQATAAGRTGAPLSQRVSVQDAAQHG